VSPSCKPLPAVALRLCAGLLLVQAAQALDPHKSLSQYSRTTWTQEHGLPQDAIRAITQTNDGYLWLGTDEGLARFDGYEFVVYDKAKSGLPSNSVAALASTADGSLWIGTPAGLTLYRDREFRTYTTRDGLPDNSITELYEDHAGTLWLIAGGYLSRFQDGKFTNWAPGKDIAVTAVRHIREDRNHDLWVSGFAAVLKMSGGKFVPVLDAAALNGNFVACMLAGRTGNFWLGGNTGLIMLSPEGKIRRFDTTDGLPDNFVRAIWQDRDGNLWVGTNTGLARRDGERFVAPNNDGRDREQVRALFEDREGDMWVGTSGGLSRLRDAMFTVFGKSEGLPSDEPNTIFQDSRGRIWVGFHDGGLMMFAEEGNRVFGVRDGVRSSEIYSIREARNGDLLIGARGGLIRMHEGRFSMYVPPDPLARLNIFDVLEDSRGGIWMATPGGLAELREGRFRIVVPGEGILATASVTLCETPDGAIWSGTYGKGLWRIQGSDVRHFTDTDGLASNEIRSLLPEPDGTLWIGTSGGGLGLLRNGKFQKFTAADGLLSDNVSDVAADADSLWLSTTRGICRVPRRQLAEFLEHRRKNLSPMNYGIGDGLRSAQCSPSFPIGGGGSRTRDGRLWFTTGQGVAVYDPHTPVQPVMAPIVHLVELTVDGNPVDLPRNPQIAPNAQRIQIRYTGVHLNAPEQVQYSYRLAGVDTNWVRAGSRRVINYNSLGHGDYRFLVRAEIPGGPVSERDFAFSVLPQFYETAWFRALGFAVLLGVAWAGYRLRLQQIRSRFALVLEERARLAREIHDTLAQGFVGISSQLDAVAMCMPDETSPARKFLDMARRMARHSLTEARRSVMDLRASALEGQDLAAALESGTRQWTAGSGVDIDVEVSGPATSLPQEVEQHLLRIAQEAVTNALKHAEASRIWIRMHTEARKIYMVIKDNGRGFDQDGVFSSMAGHFGLIGMRERAERLGGEMRLASQPGVGTEVEVKVPLP
jgi:signal transduction histidine kinase/ligand-binding sensor domain-containing protein